MGHGLFFALGGYAMGMYLMRSIGTAGVYHSELPDFMVFLDWKAYPWYWSFTDHFWYAALLVVLVPGVLAFVFGYFAFRSRIKGVYFSIITQALTYAFMLLFFRNDTGFGGNNGFTDFKEILGFPIATPKTRMALFAATGAVLLGTFLLARYVVTSKLGRVLMAIRDAESRVMFCGYNPLSYKLFIWTLSAVLCGIAGALYVPQVGIINPSEMSPANSIEIAIWTAVGGRGTLIGPILGAFIVNGAKSWFTVAFPEFWLFFLGSDVHPGHAAAAARRDRASEAQAMSAAALHTVDSGSAGTRAGGDSRRGHRRRHHARPDPLPRRHHGQLRRLQGAERPVADDRGRRTALHHRPERRRQDDDDGRDHRQDAARTPAPRSSARRSTSRS